MTQEVPCRALIDALGVGVICYDARGFAVTYNAAAERILVGLSRQRWVQSWYAFREDGAPYSEADHPVFVALRTGVAQANMVLGRRLPDGSFVWLLTHTQPLFRNGEPIPYTVVTSVTDITTLKQTEQALRHAALHDTLTGLGTRKLLYDRLGQAAARLQRDPNAHVALLFVDLDDFKTVNDALGHSAGDALLVAVAERLKGCVRAHDTVARLGGDEFAILLKELSQPEDAEGFAERILSDLEQLKVTGLGVHISASVGIALAQVDLERVMHLPQ